MLNQKTLKKYLNYDPETGVFKRKINSGKAKIGDVAGGINGSGYICIRINSVKYRAHRLAWLYVHGKFPDNQIDHINRVKTDNRIENLRDVTQSVNGRNRNLPSNNTSGHIGVKWNKKQQAWKVTVCQVHYGSFKCKLDAVAKAKSIYKELGYHENHGRACND
jgi:hypothetical protein